MKSKGDGLPDLHNQAQMTGADSAWGKFSRRRIGLDRVFLQLELDNIVTLHMRSRKFSSPQCFSEIARALANLGHIANGRQIYTPNVSDASQVTLPVLQSLGFRFSSKLINLPNLASQMEVSTWE